jgi:hypothetical protein
MVDLRWSESAVKDVEDICNYIAIDKPHHKYTKSSSLIKP